MKLVYRDVFCENILSSFGLNFRFWGRYFTGKVLISNCLTSKSTPLREVYINKYCVCISSICREALLPWADLHKIWHRASLRGRNQLCQFLSQSGQVFWFCKGLNFWLSHGNEMSPLTHGLNYCSACDRLTYNRFLYAIGTNYPILILVYRNWLFGWPLKNFLRPAIDVAGIPLSGPTCFNPTSLRDVGRKAALVRRINPSILHAAYPTSLGAGELFV